MRVRFLKFMLASVAGLAVTGEVVAQQTPNGIDYLRHYTVSTAGSNGWYQTPGGKPIWFNSLAELTQKTRDGLPIEALDLSVSAVGPGDWYRLRELRSLRLLAVFVPDTIPLVLDSLLGNIAALPRLEALRISSFTTRFPNRRSRQTTDTTSQPTISVAPRPLPKPMAGFVALRELRLSGYRLPAQQLIGRFSGHATLQRVELWGSWEIPQQTLPDNLNQLPNLISLLVDGRGWQGWETAFRGLSTLRSLNLSSVSAGGPGARSHDEGNPVIRAREERYITDLNRGLNQLTGLRQLDMRSVAQTQQLRLGNLPALTHLRLHHVTPGDTTFMGMVALESLTFDDCYMPKLPDAVCSLPRLTDLRLLRQQYTGVDAREQTIIPACLSRLESLTAMSIVNNATGQLPLRAGDLPNLRYVELTGCGLTLLPPFLTQLQPLRYLDLRKNSLSSIPDTIRAWAQLDTLSLAGNRLTELPAFLTQLRQLRMLAVGSNSLSRLPDRIGDLDSLRHLSIGDNALTALPQSIGRLRQLRSLTIGKNHLTELPGWLGQLHQLTDLFCDMPLTTLSVSMLKMKQLASLFLRNTRLRAVPDWIGSLRQLKNIRLDSDAIRTLPESFGHLTNLETLTINGEKFSRLPDSFSRLSKLTNLTVRGSNQEGGGSVSGSLTRLPPSVVNCQKLRALKLTDQPRLAVGTLFAQLPRLTALSHVDLSRNHIGTLPPMNWATLKWHSLRLAGNVLTRPPLELAQIPDLQLLDLGGNPLDASLSRSFHNHTMIQEALLPGPASR